MVEYAYSTIIFLSIFILLACIVITFFLLVLIGNLTAMKILAKCGLAVFSNHIITDCKLLNFMNKDGVCWLSIPDICYSPVMEYSDGLYKNHNYIKKDNMFGELYISGDKKANKLLELGLNDDHLVKDLSIIKGNYRGLGSNLRHANFSLLRKMKQKIIDKGIIKLCENGNMRYFYPIAMIDRGLNERHSFRFKDRTEFIKSFLEFSKIKSDNFRYDKPIIILECKTDVDIVMVLLVEKELKKSEKK